MMTRYRGDNIPPVSDYAHWNEDAQLMHYLENRYDMMHADEPLDDDFDDYDYDEDDYDDGIDHREDDNDLAYERRTEGLFG